MLTNPWVIVGLGAAWLVSLAGVGYWQNDAGHVAERAEWLQRENGDLRKANAKILSLEEDARAAERNHAQVLAGISTEREKERADANKQHAADIAAVRAGTLRLRDPNPPGLRACGSVVPGTGAGSGQRDGGTQADLSAAAAEFLFDLASDADDVARQLAACQQVVISDRAAGSR